MTMNSENRVTVEQAAAELGMNMDSVRFLMQNERLPIGYAMKKPGKKKWTYYIFRGLLNTELDRLAAGGVRKW